MSNTSYINSISLTNFSKNPLADDPTILKKLLNQIKATGANSVTYEFMVGTDINGNLITSTHPSTSDIDIISSYAHQIGLQVLLKPHIASGSDNNNLNAYNMDYTKFNVQNFFKNYTDYLTTIAQTAAKYNDEVLFLGTEQNGIDSGNLPQWTSLINSIRSVYKGTLTYDGLYWDQSGNSDYSNVGFWNQLDWVSISYYPTLGTSANTSSQQAQNNIILSPFGNTISSFLRLYQFSLQINKPIFLGEFGTTHSDLGMNPQASNIYGNGNIYDLSHQNLTVQSVYDLALLNFYTLHAASWMKGVSINSLDVGAADPSMNQNYGYIAEGWTMNGFPIMQDLTKFFSNAPVNPTQIALSSEYYDLAGLISPSAQLNSPYTMINNNVVTSQNLSFHNPNYSIIKIWASTQFVINGQTVNDSGNYSSFDILINGNAVYQNLVANQTYSWDGPSQIFQLNSNLIKDGDTVTIQAHQGTPANPQEGASLVIGTLEIDNVNINLSNAKLNNGFLQDAGLVLYSNSSTGTITVQGMSSTHNLNNNIREIDGSSSVTDVIYQGASTNFDVAYVQGGVLVHNHAQFLGSDFLNNIQTVRFDDVNLDTTSITKTAALAHSQIVDLTQLYVASFNRAPDSVGLDYWGGRLSDGMSLQDIAKSFFVQKETIAAYPTTMSANDFVSAVYNNVLSRGPDTGGLNYWVGQLNNGSVSKDAFLLAIINGAMAASGSAVDRQTLANKEAVGEHYAIYQGLNNSTYWAKDVMSGVTDQASTVTAANIKADAYAAIAANPLTSDLVVKLVGVAV